MNIPDDELPLIVRALEQYADYLKATQRDDRLFRDLADRMKRRPPQQQEAEPARKKRRRGRRLGAPVLPDVAHYRQRLSLPEVPGPSQRRSASNES